MKFLLLSFFTLTAFLPVSFAKSNLSIVRSIDDQRLPYSSGIASEKALPYLDLLELLDSEDFTVLEESRVLELFKELETNPNARNRIAGGKCAYRRYYIQKYLKKLSIVSGSLYIECPRNDGHMKLIDQVTGHRYTFSNFHDVNIVKVPDGYNVLDVQFESKPLTLSEYLAEVEASQKLKPLKDRISNERGFCYWSIKQEAL